MPAGGVPTRTLVRQGNDWKLTSPVQARADFNGADGLVGRLFQLQMKALTADDGTADLKKYGLDKPQAVATVGAGSSQAAIAIGSKADDTTVYARDLSRPMIFTVESTLLDDLIGEPPPWRDVLPDKGLGPTDTLLRSCNSQTALLQHQNKLVSNIHP